MLGILIFAAVLTYGTYALFHVLGKVGDSINSVPRKSVKDLPKLTIEDMYSPNNNLSLLTKTDVSYFVLVTNQAINKEEFVFADNLSNLKNKVVRLLKNYAALEADKKEKSITP